MADPGGACHEHKVAFKGSQCNACHGYPGLDNTGVNLKQLSRSHWDHVGQPSPVGNGSSRSYPSTVCHCNYSHNGNNVSAGSVWPGTYYTFVNIDFDPSANPANGNGPTYRGNPVPTTGNGGTGACGGLYRHGNGSAQSDWGGSTTATPPVWDNTVTASCGSCHAAGTGLSQGNHAVHIDNAGKPYGPGIAAFSAGDTCSEGTGCHTAYGLTPASTHANNQANLRTSPTDNTATILAGTQVCRNCHSTYTNGPDLATAGDTLVRTQANWDNATYKVACITCHPPRPTV